VVLKKGGEMKRVLSRGWFVLIMIACYCRLQGQFVDFKENVSRNKFLGLGMSACSTETNHGKNSYQKGYDCGNGLVSQLLNVNLLAPENIGEQFYMFNNFMYWMSPHNDMGKWNGKDAKDAKKQADAVAQPDNVFGAGVFMIVLGTSPYLQRLAASNLACPQGKTLLVAQLKYNNGNSLNVWSQDAICVAPTDDFEIQISSDTDTSVQLAQQRIKLEVQDIDWMQDAGPTANYQQAGNSPRKIRLILKQSSDQVVPVVKTVKSKTKKSKK
jgi:hypothetical protein